MIDGLFAWLSHAITGAWPLALAAAFVWGVFSVILSPCHLASIPLIIGFLGTQPEPGPRRAFRLSLFFSAGILITIALVGAATAALGRMIGDLGRWGNYAVAGIFFFVGIYLIGWIPWSFGAAGPRGGGRRGPLGALVLGLIFGLALGPCAFAFMAPILALVFSAAGESPGIGVLLLVLYGIGHCAVIVAAGTSGGAVQRYLDWNERSHVAAGLRRLCGVLVVLGGIYLIWAVQ